MTQTRRVFLTQLTVLTGSTAIGKPLLKAAKTSNYHNLLAANGSVTVYHTHDLNGQITAADGGLGGLTQFYGLLRNEKQKGLVLDSGGFLNGRHDATAQKSFISLMNSAGYLAAGLSNRELAGGHEQLAQLASAMKFSLVNCNHTFHGELGNVVKPYITLRCGAVKIGITGVCEKLTDIQYNDPVQCADYTAALLKKQEGCDVVICLSHLDDKQNNALAARSEHIDIIAGPGKSKIAGGMMVTANKAGREIMLTGADAKALTVGKIVLGFDSSGQKNRTIAESIVPGAPAGPPCLAFAYLSKVKSRLISV